jgi:hypothetical protein
MKEQDYKHHTRVYPPHHFIFYPLNMVACGVCTWFIFHDDEHAALWAALTVVFALMFMLAFMLRQHYALNNQNRIVRLELRFRYYLLTQERLELLEDRLSLGQLFALRFASDEELPGLVNRVLRENLAADDIKRAIKNWKPDHMRV